MRYGPLFVFFSKLRLAIGDEAVWFCLTEMKMVYHSETLHLHSKNSSTEFRN